MRRWIVLFGAVALVVGCGANGGESTSQTSRAATAGNAPAANRAAQSSQPAKAQTSSSGGSSLSKTLRESDPTRYLDVTVSAPGKARSKMSLISVQQALKAFQAVEGRWPKSIQELRDNGYNIPNPPPGMKYNYDPNTGKVSLDKATP